MQNESANRNRLSRKALGAFVVILLGAALGYFLFAKPRESSTTGGALRLELRGITSVAVDRNDNLYVGGDFGVKVFSPDWKPLREWKTPDAVAAVAVDGEGNVYAAYRTLVEKFDSNGKSLVRWGKGGCDTEAFGLISGIAVWDGNVFVADAGERIVYRFRDDGRYLNRIGSEEKDPEGLGIVLPSPFLDCAAGDGVLFVNNPGRKRVEQYDFDGNLLKFWGKDGWEDDAFPGCCNPTNVAVVGKDKVAVSEKGTPRVKIFDRDGRFLKILGGEAFAEESKGIDLAVDANGRIYAVDPAAGCVRVFEANE